VHVRIFIEADCSSEVVEVNDLGTLVFRLAERKVRTCLVCRADEIKYLGRGIAETFRLWRSTGSDFSFLIPYRTPPSFSFRIDGRVESFICDGACMALLLPAITRPEELTSAYECATLFIRMLAGNRISALQIPNDIDANAQQTIPLRSKMPEAAWFIPHHGDPRYLRECLHFTTRQSKAMHESVWLGIDDSPSTELNAIIADFPEVNAFYVSHPQSGPYLIKNELARMCGAPIICFQDSDDIPCFDRQKCLLNGFESDVAMVGSHEVRMNEVERKIDAVRYPLDVTSALSDCESRPSLHPTNMIRRRDFISCGCFSTTAPFAMDRQFLLRSRFCFSTINVDSFLYIRRIRSNSLTRNPDTGIGSMRRRKLSEPWIRDFGRIIRDEIALGESSLAARSGAPKKYRLVNARTALSTGLDPN
jgi:hypothetical protein